MEVREKRPWTTVAIFSFILIVTALFLEFGWEFVDPWGLPNVSSIKFDTNEFPSLVGIELTCPEAGGLLTKIDFAKKAGECSKILTPEVTRCTQMSPMRGFADKIKCSKVAKIACEKSGLQLLGLFEDDGFCGIANNETDLGPPTIRAREDK